MGRLGSTGQPRRAGWESLQLSLVRGRVLRVEVWVRVGGYGARAVWAGELQRGSLGHRAGLCGVQPAQGSFGAMLPTVADGWVELAEGVGPCIRGVLVGRFAVLPHCSGKPAGVVVSLLECELQGVKTGEGLLRVRLRGVVGDVVVEGLDHGVQPVVEMSGIQLLGVEHQG
jgi:hypothetical protein